MQESLGEKGGPSHGWGQTKKGFLPLPQTFVRPSAGRGVGAGLGSGIGPSPSLAPPHWGRLPSPVPAMITSHPNTTIAIKGHAKELNCTARGERPIIIRWEKGDTVIDPDRVMRYAIATKDNGDEVVSTLKVSAHAPVSGIPTLGKWGARHYYICIRWR